MARFLKSHDWYATSISLSFNKKPKFGTIPGAICTIISALIIISSIAVKMVDYESLTSYKVATTIHVEEIPEYQIKYDFEKIELAFDLYSADKVVNEKMDRIVRGSFVYTDIN
jgi:hypothetical protein